MINIYVKNYYGEFEQVEVEEEVLRVMQDMDNEEKANEKKETRRRDFSETGFSYLASKDLSLDEKLIEQEEIHMLHEAISHLTPMQRKRVLMYAQSMTYESIAKQESRCVSVVYNSVQKALNHLKDELSSYINE